MFKVISEPDFSALIGEIYEAGLDPGRWRETLQRIAKAFSADAAGISHVGETPADCWGVNTLGAAADERYALHYHSVNPIWRLTSRSPTGTVQTDNMVMSRETYRRTEFYNDFAAPLGVHAMLSCVAMLDVRGQTVVTLMSKHDFEPDAFRLHERLAPHLTRAVRLNHHLETCERQRNSFADALDRLERGALLVDVAARVVFANRTAQRYFEAGRELQLEAGRISVCDASLTSKLRALIAGCAKLDYDTGGGGRVFLVPKRAASQISLFVAPLSAATLGGVRGAVAVVFIEDAGTRREEQASRARRLFQLTPAESRFAFEIVKGDGLQATADRLGITLATARTHLSHIFDKTGTRRQSALVRLLCEQDPI